MMQHQYWVTKKTVQRKLGSKEDDCIISSDAELDAKLELFRSISDTCIQLQRIIDSYQERLCYLAQEENALGRYLKECGKNEKNSSAAQLLSVAGKALAYTGHQLLTVRPPLVRLHHDVETFRARAILDTRATVTEMEKVRTEYRGALSWMKSVSNELDPDTGRGLERFRKAQSYVKMSKTKFDRYMLACLQKVDLLAAARCNMFSHALVSYQNAISIFSAKSSETLMHAVKKLNDVEPFEFCAVSELAGSVEDEKENKDKNSFFNSEYKDAVPNNKDQENKTKDSKKELPTTDLLGENFSIPPVIPDTNAIEGSKQSDSTLSSELLSLNWPSENDLLGDFMPSKFLQEGTFNFDTLSQKSEEPTPSAIKDDTKKSNDLKSQMSWLSLFKELDPLANQDIESGDRA
ncbi:islet cell autoantigen 1 [Agrilus planipennis]|uniref:Islet cell autoantigen 1 n=1 Tax=Agrilus planipennis TaxID=224129 RepID=A0A1W4WF35_AGRPL|nr:islet cell autoantigen 1 [Agrilus planipennis]